MRPIAHKVFGPRFMLAMLLAAFATSAQEADDLDGLEPAVDTSAEVLEPAVDTSAAVQGEPEEELEDLQPAVSLAADVSRQESGGAVMDRIDLGRTEITGNSELPTVLYIVPWQKSDPGDLMGRPVNTLLDEVLAPVDREEFLRRVDYYGDLYGDEEQE
ncbi:MAG: hypothetical protein ACR2QT_12990 [Woeseiaceae bacterium]